jgi:hypothetical protein
MTDDAKKAGEEREMSTNSEIQRKYAGIPGKSFRENGESREIRCAGGRLEDSAGNAEGGGPAHRGAQNAADGTELCRGHGCSRKNL